MTNVLPSEVQKKVWTQQRARFVIAGSMVLLVIAAVGALALLPSYMAVWIMPQAAQSAATRTSGEEAAALAHAQQLMLQIGKVIAASSSPESAIQAALSARPAGIVIDAIAYQAGNPAQIVLSGSAPREAVQAYRSALTADTRFTSVTVPVGALVGSEGGRFSVTINGAF